MSDVLETATKYRTRLKSELSKVEEFLQMAETFSKGSTPEDRVAFFTNGSDNTMALKQPVAERPRTVSNGSGAATA